MKTISMKTISMQTIKFMQRAENINKILSNSKRHNEIIAR